MTVARRADAATSRALLPVLLCEACAPNYHRCEEGRDAASRHAKASTCRATVMWEELKIALFIVMVALGFLQLVRWVRKHY